MVDDGSTDGGTEIAAAKAAADPRFILIQPEHGGPGGARNRGVERARGEFLAFVDGDVDRVDRMEHVAPPEATEAKLPRKVNGAKKRGLA